MLVPETLADGGESIKCLKCSEGVDDKLSLEKAMLMFALVVFGRGRRGGPVAYRQYKQKSL